MNPRLSFLLDLVLFQAVWFACVLATRSPYPQILPLVGTILVLSRVIWKGRFQEALPLACTCIVIGTLGDALLVKLGFLSFGPYPSLFGAPLWMVALWMNFGLMLQPLFSWFMENCVRTLAGFSIGGALAYFSGEKLEVLSLEKGWQSILAIGAEWAVVGLILRFLWHKLSQDQET
jgi:hypothetical protein